MLSDEQLNRIMALEVPEDPASFHFPAELWIRCLYDTLQCRCLAFEHPLYKSFRDRAPRVGRRVETPHGEGVGTGPAGSLDADRARDDG